MPRAHKALFSTLSLVLMASAGAAANSHAVASTPADSPAGGIAASGAGGHTASPPESSSEAPSPSPPSPPPSPSLTLPARGPAKPEWLAAAKPAEWLDWSAAFWRIPDLDANPLLLGVARFRGPPATVVPRLERRFGPRLGSQPNNPMFVFERDGARLLARVVPVVDATTGRAHTDLNVVAHPKEAATCEIVAPPGARVLDERWRDFDEGEFSRPVTIAVFAGGGGPRALRVHFLRTLDASRVVRHGAREWVAGRACDAWALATFQDQTRADEKAWVTRVVPAPGWIVAKLEERAE